MTSCSLLSPHSLHDRKMCILGICALIDLEHRPQVVNQAAVQLIPAAILLFNGLKRAYACRAEHENDEDDDDEDGEEDDDNGKASVFDIVPTCESFAYECENNPGLQSFCK